MLEHQHQSLNGGLDTINRVLDVARLDIHQHMKIINFGVGHGIVRHL